MWRRAVNAEGQASAIAALGLIAAGMAALASQRLCTSDGRAVLAAGPVLARAQPDDIVVVDADLGRGERDRGRILFPYRPLPAVASDTPPLDLTTFPFRTARFSGDVDSKPWIGDRTLRRDGDVATVDLDDPDRLLVSLYSPPGIGFTVNGQRQPCQRPHHTGGVSCGSDAWFYVGPIVEPLGGSARLCLWAHPPRDGAALHIPLAIAPALVAATPVLSLQLNFLDEVRGEELRAPVVLGVTTGGQTSEARCANRDGSCQVDVELTVANASSVELSVSTPNNARQLVCLTGGLVVRNPTREQP